MIYLKEGRQPLDLAFDDEIVQEANGTYQLSFKYPLTDGWWEHLKPESFLLADDAHGEQEFFVFDVTRKHGYVQVYANQVATLLNGYVIDTINVDRVPGQTVMSALASSISRAHPFSFFSDIQGRHTLNLADRSVMEVLSKDKHSIIGQWGGDLLRDKYSVRLLEHGGSESEALFMYKKNLTSYEASETVKHLRTRLHFKKIVQGENDKPDKVLAVTVDSPIISHYQQIYEGHVEVNDQDVTDEAGLRAYGQAYYARTLCDLPEQSLSLKVDGVPDVPVHIFDVVSVYHERYDVDLRLKITSYRFAPMSKRLKVIGFGKVNQSLTQQVNSIANAAVANNQAMRDGDWERKLQKAINNANQAFEAEFEKSRETIADGIEQAKAAAEVVKAEVGQAVSAAEAKANQALTGMQVADQKAANALNQAGASVNLAETARQLASAAKGSLDNLRGQVEAQAREIGTKLTHDEVMQRVGTALNGYVQTSTFDHYQRETAEGLERRFTETKALIPRRVGGRNLLKPTLLRKHNVEWLRDYSVRLSYKNSDTYLEVETYEPLVVGQRYVFSWTVSYDGDFGSYSFGLFDQSSAVQISANKGRQSVSFVADRATTSILIDDFIRPDTHIGKAITFTEMQLEEGDIPSDFSPAPETFVTTTDFNHVKETAQLYERILGRTEGDVATNVARQVMTSELMQSEIRKIPSQIGGTNLCSLSGLQIGYRSQGNVSTDPNYVYSDFISVEAGQPYIWQIWNDTGQQVWAGHDFFDANKRYISDSYRSIYQNANYGKYVVVVPSEAKFVSLSFSKAIVDGTIRSKLEKGTIVTDWSPAPDDLASSTRVTQLADSYAIKTLGNANQVLSAVNIATGGVALQAGQNKLVITPQTTFFQDGTIKNAMIESLHGGKITAGSVTSVALAAESVTAAKLLVDQALFNKLTASEAHLKQLFAKNAFISSVQAVTLSANQISGGILKALNNAMEIQMNYGQILYYTDKAALKRVLSGYPTQFVRFSTGTVEGKGNAGVTVIGSNRSGTESSNDGGFVGIRAWNGPDIDKIDVVGDTVRLASSTFESPDGWDVITLPNRLEIDAHNVNHRVSSKIKVGDVWLWKNSSTYSSLRATINLLIDNVALLHQNKSTETGYSYTMPNKI